MHPSDIRIGQTELSVHELYDMMQSKRLIVGSMQKKWNIENKSMSIESILLGLTMTPIYVDAAYPDQWIVLDGGKRLDALSRFISGEFRLEGLEFLDDLIRCNFQGLPSTIQRRLLQASFTIYSINQGIPPDVRLSLIKRIVPDIKAGLSAKMHERLLTFQARILMDDLSIDQFRSVSLVTDSLSIKINYLRTLYTLFKNERFCDFNLNSEAVDIIIWTNRYAKSEHSFIVNIWSKGVSRIKELINNNDITKELKEVIRKNISAFIVFFGAVISDHDYERVLAKQQFVIWEMTEFFHDNDKSGFIKNPIQKKIDTLFTIVQKVID
ncbi:MAG: hypothetical protein Q8909_12000 [Bacteroidota bacterium]|nr:hypothetical protein [Bacteroidota bacterium]